MKAILQTLLGLITKYLLKKLLPCLCEHTATPHDEYQYSKSLKKTDPSYFVISRGTTHLKIVTKAFSLIVPMPPNYRLHAKLTKYIAAVSHS